MVLEVTPSNMFGAPATRFGQSWSRLGQVGPEPKQFKPKLPELAMVMLDQNEGEFGARPALYFSATPAAHHRILVQHLLDMSRELARARRHNSKSFVVRFFNIDPLL